MLWDRKDYAPFVGIHIKGALADDLMGALKSFQHKAETKKASETTLVFRNDRMELASDPRFLANTVWQVRYGFPNRMSPIITGIIRQVEPIYAAERTIKVVLMDHTINLAKSSSSRNWGRISSAEIAEKIGEKHGLRVFAAPSNDIPKKAHIQPGTVNDLQYLRDLAAEVNYEVFVQMDPLGLVYRPIPYDVTPEPLKLHYHNGPDDYSFVLSFKPKIKTLGPIKTGGSRASTKRVEKGKQTKISTATEGAKQYLVTSNGISGYTEGMKVTYYIDQAGNHVSVNQSTAAILDSSVENAKVAFGDKVVERVTDYNWDMINKNQANAKNKAVPSGGGATRAAATARRQMLEKSEGATSEHPLTALFQVGKMYTWTGLDKVFNRSWYCQSVTSTITGTSSKTTVEWKMQPDEGKSKSIANRYNTQKGSGSTETTAGSKDNAKAERTTTIKIIRTSDGSLSSAQVTTGTNSYTAGTSNASPTAWKQ